jgi:tRNA modification GTPase
VKSVKGVKSVKVALASPLGSCAIGVVQVAGEGAVKLVSRFFRTPIGEEVGRIRMGDFHDGEGRTIDRVLAVTLPGQIVEITTHGGLRIVQRIVETLKLAGAELIKGEELIPEAFQVADEAAEAYRLLPEAKTTLAVKFLLAQAHGGLSELLKSKPTDEQLRAARRYWPAVKVLLSGVRIVMAGPPNAGKSTLLNALARTEHAIVADLPGTTRDYVQTQIDLAGLPVELIDTAGLGTTTDPLAEQIERRTIEQIRRADVVLLVLDATDRLASEEFLQRFRQMVEAKPVLIVINKTDRPDDEIWFQASDVIGEWPTVAISALAETHLEDIGRAVWRLLGLEGFDYREPTEFYSRE